MNPDLPRIRESKQAFRRELAERPIAEKLRMLDALRQRTLAIRRAFNHTLSPHPVEDFDDLFYADAARISSKRL